MGWSEATRQYHMAANVLAASCSNFCETLLFCRVTDDNRAFFNILFTCCLLWAIMGYSLHGFMLVTLICLSWPSNSEYTFTLRLFSFILQALAHWTCMHAMHCTALYRQRCDTPKISLCAFWNMVLKGVG